MYINLFITSNSLQKRYILSFTVNIMSYKISVETEKCIGCGACVALCPDNWEMDENRKAHPKKSEVEDIGCNQKAADGCPIKIIHIKEE